jgi:hypothetical protein
MSPDRPVEAARPQAWSVLHLLAGIAALASLMSFAQSYHAEYLWAASHGYQQGWAELWPFGIDIWIAAGEIALYEMVRRQIEVRYWWTAIGMGLIGMGGAVAFNAGHVGAADWTTRVSAGVPPVVATGCLAMFAIIWKIAHREDDGLLPQGSAELAPAAPGSAEADTMSGWSPTAAMVARSISPDLGEMSTPAAPAETVRAGLPEPRDPAIPPAGGGTPPPVPPPARRPAGRKREPLPAGAVTLLRDARASGTLRVNPATGQPSISHAAELTGLSTRKARQALELAVSGHGTNGHSGG